MKTRLELFDKLIEDKKPFILIVKSKECNDGVYSVYEGAEKILKQENFSYFVVGTSVVDGEELLENSKLEISNAYGAVVIVKEGKVYASISSEEDSIKNDDELKNWLNKYIDLE